MTTQTFKKLIGVFPETGKIKKLINGNKEYKIDKKVVAGEHIFIDFESDLIDKIKDNL